ncbi:MAG: PKD domain-containing protein [Candidatus Bipolaricaulis anaerobius]|nr:PKD domain-containing protein [Candidatus Bipolaricaulis anaerobius]
MKRWWAVVMGGTLFLSGCARVAPDPCRGVAPPVATFRVSPEEGELPLLVTFDAGDSFASEGQIVGYQWEFGDGVTGTGPVVQHVFDRDPDGLEEQEFPVTLTVTQEAATEGGVCHCTSPAMRVLRYGKSYPLNVVGWELMPAYDGSLIEGVVRNESADRRVTHAEVYARFYREPGHVLVGEAHRELWDIRPGEERSFMIPTYLWPWQFDWVELRTEAFTAQP